MRRPLVCLFLAQTAGILTARYAVCLPLHLCALAAGAFFVCRKRPDLIRGSLFLAASLAAGLLLGWHSLVSPGLLLPLEGRVVHMEGVVTAAEVRENYLLVTWQVEEARETGQAPFPLKEGSLLRLERSGTGEDLLFAANLVGRRIRCSGPLQRPQGRRNPGGFDYALYLRGQGVRTLASISRFRFEVGPVERHFSHFLSLRKGLF